MNGRMICVLGGSGFVGRHFACGLAGDGWRVRVPTRRRERKRDLLVVPAVELIEADVHDPAVLDRVFAGCDTAVNLIGILNETGDDGRGFHRAHVELTEKVVAACRRQGVRRYLHMSALNAGDSGPSFYLRSKGLAENLAHAAAGGGLTVTSFRPSVIFGAEDRFLNLFAGLLRVAPILPLACPGARFAPVYVGDVARAFIRSIDDPATAGRRYDLCGPSIHTFRALVDYVNRLTGAHRPVLPLPDVLARLQANVMEHLPGKPFSRDNLRSLGVDSVCNAGAGLAALGITPTPIEAVAPLYLGGSGTRSRYDGYRAAGRT